jgi:hypothetical protein
MNTDTQAPLADDTTDDACRTRPLPMGEIVIGVDLARTESVSVVWPPRLEKQALVIDGPDNDRRAPGIEVKSLVLPQAHRSAD